MRLEIFFGVLEEIMQEVDIDLHESYAIWKICEVKNIKLLTSDTINKWQTFIPSIARLCVRSMVSG